MSIWKKMKMIPISPTHLFSTSIQPPMQQHAHNTWQPAAEEVNLSRTCSFRTHIKTWLYSKTPLKGPRSCCGCEPCCPARSCGALACWCRTWPGCTGGPPAFPDHSHAPSSALWPSALSWCALSDPLRLTETPCATIAENETLDKICHRIFHHSSAHLDGLVAVGTVVNDGERLLKTGTTDTNDIRNQLTDGNDHLEQ